ncbi:hypothetical protein LZ575_06075 [Antarcticibacterium sp. 1MA-6-2]|uniref:hypothetical protein n=1 Tax=Antarcticibacterium sp. 1MA-6-2 TaxID=2908210 RepID=UPI001F4064C5|nr:hypothetical protein [Antarcticibacterium sp. 1MA-6-2]UJH92145.1 hypothetical protein LZ575_06075 [Antarcticibacterium sp. 1MA-6-2]
MQMTAPQTGTSLFAIKEIDMALRYIREERENVIPQDSFREDMLNELEDFNLIKKLSNGTYIITEQGLYARKMGAHQYIEMKKSEEFFSNYSPEKYNSKKKLIDVTFMVSLLLLIILLFSYREDFFQ